MDVNLGICGEQNSGPFDLGVVISHHLATCWMMESGTEVSASLSQRHECRSAQVRSAPSNLCPPRCSGHCEPHSQYFPCWFPLDTWVCPFIRYSFISIYYGPSSVLANGKWGEGDSLSSRGAGCRRDPCPRETIEQDGRCAPELE